jgi:hypothetical protein
MIQGASKHVSPFCSVCGRGADVSAHWPLARRELVSRGVSHPDMPGYRRSFCAGCYSAAVKVRRAHTGAT